MCDCSTTPPLDSVPSLATHLLTMWQIPSRSGTCCPFRIAGRCSAWVAAAALGPLRAAAATYQEEEQEM